MAGWLVGGAKVFMNNLTIKHFLGTIKIWFVQNKILTKNLIKIFMDNIYFMLQPKSKKTPTKYGF